MFRDKNEMIVNQGHTYKGVVVEDDVLVGAIVVVLECRIGQGAVIGEGSVVTKEILPYSVAAGTPAKVIDWRV